uniref:Uncharacterized protein n=1 Tax=Fagus sylvatica TaxID=28930 RepID=A0A2N9FQJ9_FAGSY
MEGGAEVKEGDGRRGSWVGGEEGPRGLDQTNSGLDLWPAQPHGGREERDREWREAVAGGEKERGGWWWG